MIVLAVAATWIAISAAGAKALVLFARAAAMSDCEAELAHIAPNGATVWEDGCQVEPWPYVQGLRP